MSKELFEAWWQFTGRLFWRRVETEEQVKALCSVAYHQGCADAGNTILRDLQQLTALSKS